jgi:hypothetical protein
MQYRERRRLIEATQWFKNGDHPLDYTKDAPSAINAEIGYSKEFRKANLWEGDVVRYYRHPEVRSTSICGQCNRPMLEHGWIENSEHSNSHKVCPGDWIVTDEYGDNHPYKPEAFHQIFERAEE